MARGAERRALGPPPDLERVRERSLSLAEAAADERGEDGQEGLQEAAADQDLSELYRNSTVARALADALAQLSREEDVPMEVLGATMGAFDKVCHVCGWALLGSFKLGWSMSAYAHIHIHTPCPWYETHRRSSGRRSRRGTWRAGPRSRCVSMMM